MKEHITLHSPCPPMKQHAISLQINQIIDSNDNKNDPASLVLEDAFLIPVAHFHCDIDYTCLFIYLSESHIFQLAIEDRR